MSNFCTKCGAMLEEDYAFCGKCGASSNKAATVTAATNTLPRVEAGTANVTSSSKKTHRLIGIIVFALVAVIIGIVTMSFISNNYRFVIDRACQALEARNYDKFIGCFPPTVQDTVERYRLDMGQTKRSFIEQTLGDNEIKLSYKVLNENRLSKSYIKSQFIYTDFYDDLEAAYELELNFTLNLNGDKTSSNSIMYVGKINGRWYIIDSGMNSYNLLGLLL